jgi:DNA repair protein RadC
LTTGTTKEDVLEMSSRIIRDYGEKSILAEKDASKLSADLDIPIVKACQIVAVGELGPDEPVVGGLREPKVCSAARNE